MDIFRFHNPDSPSKMDSGEIVNGIISKLWVERYQKEGECEFIGPVRNGLREKLPVGSFVSHINTGEIMMIENHEISDNRGQNSQIKITGTTYETYFTNRIVGSNILSPVSHDIIDYPMWPEKSWRQIVRLVQDHIYASELWDDGNAIPFTTVIWDVPEPETPGVEEVRTLSRGTLYEHVLNLLKVDNLGIRIMRPGAVAVPYILADSSNVFFIIHKGVDRSTEVIFSYDTGEIESADYLWSNKKLKNAALVSGKWVEVFIPGLKQGIERRVMFVSASDIDDTQEVPPTGLALSWIVAAMKERGNKALLAQKDVALTQAEISRGSIRPKYGIDYRLGDLITVTGGYNESAVMRVTEHVEVEDEAGYNEYPIVEIDPPEEDEES